MHPFVDFRSLKDGESEADRRNDGFRLKQIVENLWVYDICEACFDRVLPFAPRPLALLYNGQPNDCE